MSDAFNEPLNNGVDSDQISFIQASLAEASNRRAASVPLQTEISRGVQVNTVIIPSTISLPPTTLNSSIEIFGGGGGASGTFLASLETNEKGEVTNIKVTSGSYHILNTNTDVPAIEGDGQYVYAIIEHSNAGIFKSFKIEISQTSKEPTNLDDTSKFVQFSNVLLAEGMVSGGKPVMVQRRVGNLSLIHQVVSGNICLWAYSSGGTSL